MKFTIHKDEDSFQPFSVTLTFETLEDLARMICVLDTSGRFLTLKCALEEILSKFKR